MPTNPSIARHTAFNFLTLALNSIMGVALTALVARVLAPERMGLYTLATWMVAVAGLVANLGYVTAALKHMAESLGRDDEAEAAGILAFSSRQVLLTGVLAGLLLLGISPWLARLYGSPLLGPALAVGAVGVIPTALVTLYTAACQALYRYDQVAILTGLNAILMVAGTAIALVGGGGLVGLLAATALAQAVTVLGYLVVLGRWREGWWHALLIPERRRDLRRYQLPVFVMLMLDAVVWQRSEVFFLGASHPGREVAFYGLAFNLANMGMKLIPGTLIGLLIPRMARAQGAGDEAQTLRIFRESCRYMAMLAWPVAVGGSLLSVPLVQLLYGPGYEPVAGLLSALLLVNAVVMIYGFPTSSLLYAANGQTRLVRIGIGIAVLNLALAATLIPPWGAWGAVAANGLAQLASLYPGLVAARKLTGAVSPLRSVVALALAAFVMGAPVLLLVRLVPPWAALVLGPVLGAACYGLLLFKTGLLGAQDLALMGEFRFLRRLGWQVGK